MPASLFGWQWRVMRRDSFGKSVQMTIFCRQEQETDRSFPWHGHRPRRARRCWTAGNEIHPRFWRAVSGPSPNRFYPGLAAARKSRPCAWRKRRLIFVGWRRRLIQTQAHEENAVGHVRHREADLADWLRTAARDGVRRLLLVQHRTAEVEQFPSETAFRVVRGAMQVDGAKEGLSHAITKLGITQRSVKRGVGCILTA